MTYSCGYLVAIQSTLSGRGPSTIFLFSLDSSDLINRTSGAQARLLRNGNAEGESVLIQRLRFDWNNHFRFHFAFFEENPLITWSFSDRISLSVLCDLS